MRPFLAVLVATTAAALGAVILGEYEMSGLSAPLAGVVFGFVVAEASLLAARRPATAVLVIVPAVTAAALTWALWISTGRDLSYAAAEGWAAIPVGAAAAALWLRSVARRAANSPQP